MPTRNRKSNGPYEPTRNLIFSQRLDILDISNTNNWNYPTTSSVLNELSTNHLPFLITADSLPNFFCPLSNRLNYHWTKYRKRLTLLTTTSILRTQSDIDNQ